MSAGSRRGTADTAGTGALVRTAPRTAAASGGDSCTGPYPRPQLTAAGPGSGGGGASPASPRSSRRCPSKTSGERHSTPVNSPTGKRWSPAFHLAEDAPVQNQRKETALPSNDARPSYALKRSGAAGA